MKKKILSILITVLSLCTCIFTLTACGENEPPHTHEYTTLKYDAISHWYECTCGDKYGTEDHKGGTATETNKATCSVCNQEYGELLAHSHSFVKQAIEYKYLKTPAKCESKAEYYYSCECGEKGTDAFEYGFALGHEFGGYISDNNATCEEKGSVTGWCIHGCGTSDTLLDAVPALGHEFVEYIFDNNAKCEEDGTETSVCSRENCNREDTRTAINSKHGHNFGDWSEIKAPTCIVAGEEIRNCTYDNSHKETREIAPKGHDYCETMLKVATCTALGLKKYVCDCGFEKTEDIPVLSHAYTKGWQKEDDKHYKICDYGCGTKTLEGEHSLTNSNICNVCLYIVHTENLAYSLSSDGTYYIVTGIGIAETPYVSIPDTVNSKPVKEIAVNAFKNNKTITHLILPESIEIIGTQAFYGCTALSSITIGESLTKIGKEAFYNTAYYNAKTNWTNNVLYIGNCLITARTITLGTVTTKEDCYLIADNAFDGCETIIGLETNLALKYVGDDALTGLKGLLSATIPYCANSTLSKTIESLTIIKGEIGNYAFSGYEALKSIIYLDGGVTSIGSSAFYGCSSLTSVTIGNGVESIGSDAFYACSGLTEITLPFVGSNISFHFGSIFGTSFYTGSYSAKSGAETSSTYYYIPTSLKKVTITGGHIGYHAFYNCRSLTSVTIGDNVTSIGDSAFYDCRVLPSITIPGSVTSIGSDAFYGCSSLTRVNYLGTVDSWAQIQFDDYYANPLYYTKKLYINDILITELDITTATKISDYAFYSSSITSVIVGDKVTSIGGYAFYGCWSLTSVVIGNSVKSLGSSAFYNCYNLTSVTIGNSVKSLGSSAFYGCSGLTRITIPGSVTSIGSSAFSGCRSLTSVNYLGTVDSWASIEFGNNSANPICYAKNLYINDVLQTEITVNAEKINGSAFYNCDSLTSVTIANNVQSIGDRAFYNCYNLTSVYYKGTASEWENISISSYNTYLTSATRYYYSETEPSLNADSTAYNGNYWKYDENGEIVVWEYIKEN